MKVDKKNLEAKVERGTASNEEKELLKLFNIMEIERSVNDGF